MCLLWQVDVVCLCVRAETCRADIAPRTFSLGPKIGGQATFRGRAAGGTKAIPSKVQVG